MIAEELKDIALCGETTTIQFKQEFTGQKEIAKEMIAFANTRGGKIIFGIKDRTGEFKTIVWRTNSDNDTSSANDKEEKSSEKSSEKILKIIKGNPSVTIAELAKTIGISSRAVEKHIKLIQVEYSLHGGEFRYDLANF